MRWIVGGESGAGDLVVALVSVVVVVTKHQVTKFIIWNNGCHYTNYIKWTLACEEVKFGLTELI